jgi:hypothetical protein
VTIVAAVLVLAVVIGWPKQGQVSGWVTTGVVSLVTVVAAIVIGKVRRRHYELWAHYRGADVRVLDLASGEIFWQICRALIRAREAHDAAATAADAATATERPAVPATRVGGAPAVATAGAGKVGSGKVGSGKVGSGSVVAVRTGAGNLPAVRVAPVRRVRSRSSG